MLRGDELRFFYAKELMTFLYTMSECMSFVKIVSVSFAKSYIHSLQGSNIRIYNIGNNLKLRNIPKL